MTSRNMIADAMIAIKSEMSSTTPALVVEDARCSIMSAIAVDGRYDVDEAGLRRSRTGLVGDAAMTVQVAQYGACTLFHFYAVEGFHSRRLLLDETGKLWLDDGGRAVPHAGKYAPVVTKIMQARAN